MQLLKLRWLWHGQELNPMSSPYNCRICGEPLDEHSDIEITRCYQSKYIENKTEEVE